MPPRGQKMSDEQKHKIAVANRRPIPESKACTVCEEVKPHTEFYRRRMKTRAGAVMVRLRADCKQCAKEASRRWRKRNPGAVKEHNRVGAFKRYGISEEDYRDLYRRQEGRCAICLNRQDRLMVDHCHDTDAVRGLLCTPCNTGIGLLGDRAPNAIRAAAYLMLSESRFHVGHAPSMRTLKKIAQAIRVLHQQEPVT